MELEDIIRSKFLDIKAKIPQIQAREILAKPVAVIVSSG
jgi:hypothetical protein